MRLRDESIKRPLQHLVAVGRRYPHAWKQVDMFRSIRGKGVPDWPEWCFLPLAAACAIATGGDDNLVAARAGDIAVIGALAAWRVTKGIYHFDETVLDDLWSTPVSGDIPAEVLERLPEWCCYVPLWPPRPVFHRANGEPVHQCYGFFVHLEYDTHDGRRELRLLLDVDDLVLLPIPLHLSGTLRGGIEAASAEAIKNRTAYGVALDAPTEMIDACAKFMVDQARELEPFVSVALYLCSTAAEIRGRDGEFRRLHRPFCKRTKSGIRMFPPDNLTYWEVAYRLGAALRTAYAETAPSKDRGGTHARPRAHIRRAHWHAFWTGPRATLTSGETERKLVLKWLPPIPVNVTEDQPTIPTVRTV